MNPTFAPQQAAVAAAARPCAGSAAAYQGNLAVVTMWASTTDWFAKHLTTKRPARHLGGFPT